MACMCESECFERNWIRREKWNECKVGFRAMVLLVIMQNRYNLVKYCRSHFCAFGVINENSMAFQKRNIF
ncbi:hypothetical protein L1887_31443 [Cichorium endivia]|nr:hypothetical protein L1887_31443 [Cichorium endivia]